MDIDYGDLSKYPKEFIENWERTRKPIFEANVKKALARDWFEDPYLNEIYDRMMGPFSGPKIWTRVVEALHSREFTYIIPLDENRYKDGLSWRKKIDPHRSGPCTVLEMMCGLADRMEVEIMQDTRYGDRTATWFQEMLYSLGLYNFYDEVYDEHKVKMIIDKFLRREYTKTGKGGLFTFKKSVPGDPRNEEIWYQMNWWVSENF